jgi:hypothetical protein
VGLAGADVDNDRSADIASPPSSRRHIPTRETIVTLRMRILATVLAAVAFVACEEPPIREIEAAHAALDRARQAGAAIYAPERFREAAAALETARAKVGEKEYRAALSAAADAGEKSKAALQAAEAARVVAKGSAETALVEVQGLFDEIGAVREQAAEARVPPKAFADLDHVMEAARRSSETVAEAIGRGDFLEARKAAADLKAKAADLPDRFRQAAEGWQRSHGRRRTPDPRKPQPHK